MMRFIKDLKSLITLLLTLALIAATFLWMIDAKDFFAIVLMVFTYYFSRKLDNWGSKI